MLGLAFISQAKACIDLSGQYKLLPRSSERPVLIGGSAGAGIIGLYCPDDRDCFLEVKQEACSTVTFTKMVQDTQGNWHRDGRFGPLFRGRRTILDSMKVTFSANEVKVRNRRWREFYCDVFNGCDWTERVNHVQMFRLSPQSDLIITQTGSEGSDVQKLVLNRLK